MEKVRHYCLSTLLLAFIVAIFCPAFYSDADAQSWTASGLGGGGGIEQPSISPHDNRLVYLSSDMSGVYRSRNFGRSWSILPFRSVGQDGITDRGRSSPVQFTSNANIIYAMHRDAFPLQFNDRGNQQANDANLKPYAVKSTDAGRTFKKVADAIQIFADPRSTQRIVINTAQRLRYSTNGGRSFITARGISPSNGVLLFAGAFFSGNDVFVATHDGLYRADTSIAGTWHFRPVGNALPPGKSIATFSAAKVPGSGAVRFFAVTYDNAFISQSLGSLWGLSYPRIQALLFYRTDLLVGDIVGLHRMDWQRGSITNRWQPLKYRSTEVIPYWIRTSRNNINTVYIGGVDRNPWMRPTVLRHRSGGNIGNGSAGHGWVSVFGTDPCQGVPCGPMGSVRVNRNIATSWFGSDGNYTDGAELNWGWGPNAEGMAVDPNNANRLILTTNNIHVSENAGASWRQAYSSADSTNPANNPTPRHDRARRYRSNGMEPTLTQWLNWTKPDGNMVAGMVDIHGMLSNDNGRSWRSLANTLPMGNTYRIAASKTAGNNRLYAASSTINDIYLAHSRLQNFERDTNINAPDDCLLPRTQRSKAVGSVSVSSNQGVSWEPLQWFKCPVIWVETVANDPNRLYVGVIHGNRGGIYTTSNLAAARPVFYPFLYKGPGNSSGNPYNVHEFNNGDLLTSWSVRVDGDNYFRPTSGLYWWRNNLRRWQKPAQPPAMRKWTGNISIDPHDSTVWYAAASNVHGRFKRRNGSRFSNAVNAGGGGVFRFRNSGASYTRITPASLYRVHSISVNPRNPNEAYVASAEDGLWKTDNLRADQPLFRRVRGYPYRSPFRIFYAPDATVWVTSFGGGVMSLKQSSVLAAIERVWVPTNQAQAGNIIDADINSLWVNDGTRATSGFTVYLKNRYKIGRILYKDPYPRDLAVKVGDQNVFRGWTRTDTNNGYQEIRLNPPVTGCAINFYHFGDWIAPSDVKIYGEQSGPGDC